MTYDGCWNFISHISIGSKRKELRSVIRRMKARVGVMSLKPRVGVMTLWTRWLLEALVAIVV